jgi:hypothetical protein
MVKAFSHNSLQFDSDIVDVPNAGTAVQLSNTTKLVLWIKFTAPAANSGLTYVGLSDVSATGTLKGYPLTAAGGVDATLELNFEANGGSVLMNTLYVDAATNGDDVAYAVIYQ